MDTPGPDQRTCTFPNFCLDVSHPLRIAKPIGPTPRWEPCQALFSTAFPKGPRHFITVVGLSLQFPSSRAVLGPDRFRGMPGSPAEAYIRVPAQSLPHSTPHCLIFSAQRTRSTFTARSEALPAFREGVRNSFILRPVRNTCISRPGRPRGRSGRKRIVVSATRQR